MLKNQDDPFQQPTESFSQIMGSQNFNGIRFDLHSHHGLSFFCGLTPRLRSAGAEYRRLDLALLKVKSVLRKKGQ